MHGPAVGGGRGARYPVVGVVLLLLGALLVDPLPEARADDALTVQLNWRPTGGFSAYYGALDWGFYRQQGLDVQLVHGDHRTDSIAVILSDAAQIGLSTGTELVKARAQGLPVKAIAAIYQRSPFVFVTLPETGITNPRQFVGQRIRVTQDILPTLRAVMGFLGYQADSYSPVYLPSDVDRMLAGDVPIWGAYVSGLVTRLRLRGIQPNLIFPGDYGVVSYAQLIVSTDDFIAAHPDVLARFLQATIHGILTTLQAPERIGPLLTPRAPGLDLETAVQEVIATTPLIITGEAPIGWMDARIWSYMVRVLQEAEQIDPGLAADDLARDLMDAGPIRMAHQRLGR